MASFSGFPPGTRSIPVPAPLLGPLLESITDMAELKCTLRFLWLVGQQRGHPRIVLEASLVEDPVLRTALGSVQRIRDGLRLAVERGTLLAATGAEGDTVYLLHSAENRSPAEQMGPAPTQPAARAEGTAEDSGPNGTRPNIYRLYEEELGLMLTPLVADELRDAEQQYPWPWIEAAFRLAVVNNKRSWRYIARVLERWAAEGRVYGESGGHPETLTAAEYLRRHGLPRRQR